MRGMQTYTNGTLHVLTFKDGLLSKIAHDLQLSLTRFEVTEADGAITGHFWPESFQVDGSVKNGQVDPHGLSGKDQRDILKAIQQKILHTKRHPTVDFEGTLEGDQLSGNLTLQGQSQPISCTIDVTDGHIRGEVTIQPTRWGISPYKALMGAIKLKDRLVIRFDLS